MKKHWPCLLLLILTGIDLMIPDPIPIVDEALLAGLTAVCFAKRGKKVAGKPGSPKAP